MSIETIKAEIESLPEAERHSLVAWINGLDYDDWDREMARDFSPGGRGAKLVERVKREIAEGKATSFQTALGERLLRSGS